MPKLPAAWEGAAGGINLGLREKMTVLFCKSRWALWNRRVLERGDCSGSPGP